MAHSGHVIISDREYRERFPLGYKKEGGRTEMMSEWGQARMKGKAELRKNSITEVVSPSSTRSEAAISTILRMANLIQFLTCSVF